MKKAQYVWGMIICCIIMFLSCTKNSNDASSALLPELLQAEDIMYELPDSALHILQTMPIPQPSDKLQYATWALFMTQAKYKLYMNQSDSLINIALDYFINLNTPQRKALSFYLKAALLKENMQIEDAQKYYLKAIENIEITDDYLLANLICTGLGSIYIYRGLYDYALDIYQKAFQYALKTSNNRSIAISYIYLGRIFVLSKDYSKAIEYYKNAIQLTKNIGESKIQLDALNELASIYNNAAEYNLALSCLKESFNLSYEKGIDVTEQQYFVLGQTYLKLNIRDSAFIYLDKASISSNIYTQQAALLNLFYLKKEEKEYGKATYYIEKAWFLNDSIQKVDKSNLLVEMQEKYNQQKILNEKKDLELRKDKIIRNVLFVLMFLTCIIALLIYMYQKRLMQKERLIQKATDEIRIKSIQIQENESLIIRNQERIYYLDEQIEKNKDKQEQMEEQLTVLFRIKEHNKNLQDKNSILQDDINRISSILKEKSDEIKRLETLAEENLFLHDREKFLTSLLVQKNEILNRYREKPQYIDVYEWDGIIRAVDYIFNNYSQRLSKLIPSLTDNDIHLCCLIKLHLSNQIIATLLAISPTSVTKRKMRLKERILQQLGSFKESQSLDIWLWEF